MKKFDFAFLKLNVILTLILVASVSFFTKNVFALNEFLISKVDIDSDNIIKVNLIFNSDIPNTYGFKIGVSCDNSDFRLGNILNLDTNKYVNYLTGSWSDTPTFALIKNDEVNLVGKVFDTSKCTDAYLKIRAKKPEIAGYFDTIYSENIKLTSITPSPTIVATVVPTIIPTITPTVIISPSVDENSEDVPLTEAVKLSIDEKANIFISEFLPNPSSDKNEWVEIYNKNDHKIVMDSWFIDDVADGGGTPFLFSLTLEAKKYGIVEITKSLLNNTEDSVALLDEDKKIIHRVSYKKTIQNNSIQKNLYDQKWYITEETTKNSENININVSPITPQPKKEESDDLLIYKPTVTSITPSPLVLGLANVSFPQIATPNAPEFLVPKPPSRFTIEKPENNFYIITEKEIPNTFEVLLKFIEHAFW